MCFDKKLPKSKAGIAMLAGIKDKEKELDLKSKCTECYIPISEPEEVHSKKNFNRALCIKCQKLFK